MKVTECNIRHMAYTGLCLKSVLTWLEIPCVI